MKPLLLKVTMSATSLCKKVATFFCDLIIRDLPDENAPIWGEDWILAEY